MDVSHELGALRFVVDSPLSSKVAMFNQHVNQHKQAQLLNPFSSADGRASPKPSFSKDEYGKPLAGSLTEMRGQKANIHVLKEMLELCQIIDSEGYNVKDEPTMRVIPFGELFNIYNYISDKVVGILLRARKHKLVEFEGEMLFQRRDDDVPIFLLKPVHEIRRDMEDKIESIKRCGSPAPQATSVLLDKKAFGLDVPKGASPRSSVSRTPSPQTSKAGTPLRETKIKPTAAAETTATPKMEKTDDTAKPTNPEVVENKPSETSKPAGEIQKPMEELPKKESPQQPEAKEEIKPAVVKVVPAAQPTTPVAEVPSGAVETPTAATVIKTDVNNNSNIANNDLPTIIIEASAVYVRPAETEKTAETTTSNPVSAASESSAPVASTASA